MILTIEGNIGSGKSTLVTHIARLFPNVSVLQEPVDVWNTIQDSDGKTILEKYYEDQDAYAFPFQMMAFITRARQLRNASAPDKIIITERSVFTDREIFAKMLHDTGKMNDIEHAVYLKWFDELVSDIEVSGTIYIQTSVEKCFERITLRNRSGENNITREYLESCHEYHERWLQPWACGPDTLVLDGNVQYTDDIPEDWKTSITTFVSQLSTFHAS
jgi:deoxyadenosine/deoxycytidine kinase